MRQKTLLALALLLAAPLLALAAPSDPPVPLPWFTAAPSVEPAPALASCAALPTTGAPQVRSEQDLDPFVGADLVVCSAYCGASQCLGHNIGDPCVLGPGKVGLCTQSTLYCSTDGIKNCSCIWQREWP